MRMVEALLFAAAEPLDIDSIAGRLPEGADVGAVIEDLQKAYEDKGVNLVRIANKWMFRTADESFLPDGAGGGGAETALPRGDGDAPPSSLITSPPHGPRSRKFAAFPSPRVPSMF